MGLLDKFKPKKKDVVIVVHNHYTVSRLGTVTRQPSSKKITTPADKQPKKSLPTWLTKL